MDRRQKIFIAVLVVIGLLYGWLLMGSSGGGSGASMGDKPGWLAWMEGRLAGQSPLRMRQTSGKCKKGEAYLIFEGKTCRLDLSAADAPLRVGDLRLDEGIEVELTLDQPGTLTQEQTLRSSSSSAELKVMEKGGVLKLRCRAGEGQGSQKRCVLRLG